MLVVHSSSRCDVCLSEYSWETSGKRPHAIACGHIFCRDCLYANTPPLCPLCRHIYQPNKMKRLHVDKPEDIDDHKEVDLLQRLVVSWDTPPEQLQEVVNEVDLWLDNRSEEACVPLRKARNTLGRTQQLKSDEMVLRNTVHSLEYEIRQWDASMMREQAKSGAARESFIAQIDSMTKEILDLRGQVERFQTQYYSKYSSKNPLPAPPRPLLTPNLPSFEQALSESGSGARIMELPSSPISPYPKFEVEAYRKPKRKSNLAERPYSAYDDPRYQQGSSVQAAPAREVTPSHYVQAHINVVTDAQSPQAHSNRSQPEFETTNPSLDAYSLTHAYLREYSTGFLSGHQAATSGRRKDATRGINAPRQPTQPATAFEQPVDDYRPLSANVYHSYPYSAPVTREISPLRTHRRRNTAQSSILSSGSSPVRGGSDSSRSRSRSRGAHGSAASPAQDVQFSNSRLASIMLGAELSGPPLLRQPSPVRSPSPPHQELDPPPAAQRTRSPTDRRNSPSAQSRRTWDSGSWGTPAPSHLTEGSLIPGLVFFRTTGSRPTSFEGGQGVTNFPLLNSDGQSVRTRQSISDLGYDESTSQISRSPPRPVDSMVGVIPSDLNPGPYRNAYSESHLLQHSNGWNANGNAARTTRSSGHYSRYEDRAPPHENGNSLNGHSSSHPDRHVHSSHSHQERAQYRSPAPFDSPAREPTWGDPWASDQGNGYAVNGGSWPYSNEGQPPPQAERRHTSRTSSDENARRGRAHRTRPVESLPAESPADVAADYGYDDSYGAQPHSGHGAASRIVGHSEPEAAAPSSFMGNALGLELAAGPTSINAPTPMVPQTFLQSWSQDH